MALPTATNQPTVRAAWRGPALLVTDPDGGCGGVPLTGFFFREARHLQELRFTLNGEAALGGSIAQAAPHRLEWTGLYPPVDEFGGGGSGSGGPGTAHGLTFRALELRLVHTVSPASLEASLVIANRSLKDAEFEVAWALAADFVDLGTTQPRAQPGPEIPVGVKGVEGGVVFRSEHEELPLETQVRGANGTEWHWADGQLRARVHLAPQQARELGLRVRAVDRADPIDETGEARRIKRQQEWYDARTTLWAPGDTPLVESTSGAMQDLGSLALLDGAEDEWMTPAAGIPLYLALFGRDALTTGWQAAVFDGGELIRDTLAALRRLQGTEINPARDEQPGRIIQQARRGPQARLGRTPFGRYYADFASPFMFIIGLGQLYAWSGREEDVRCNWDAARRILDWAREYGDRDGDGYLEYLTQAEQGPAHQGWKDSNDAVVYPDGRQVEPPVAVCEIQGSYHAALQIMAALSVAMGERENALALWREAGELKTRFNRDFWLEEEGYVAFGLDADKHPIRVLTSNAAQCLTTWIVSDEHAPRLVRALFDPALWSGWGLRTLDRNNPAYNPLSYHLGSVWPVENGTVIFGLRRYGFDDQALQLARGIYDLARVWGGRTPECVGGYAREELGYPGSYPRANAPQAWNQSTLPILVQSLLGMRAVAALHTLAVDPVLPVWLPDITLRNLRVGEARVSLRFHRDSDGESHVEVLEQQGTLHLIRQPPLDSLSIGVWDRLGALVQDVLPF
ncbi:glycogen debranching N-terminal domain-containing protein [soil metagenome]